MRTSTRIPVSRVEAPGTSWFSRLWGSSRFRGGSIHQRTMERAIEDFCLGLRLQCTHTNPHTCNAYRYMHAPHTHSSKIITNLRSIV